MGGVVGPLLRVPLPCGRLGAIQTGLRLQSGKHGVAKFARGADPFTQADARRLSNLLPFRQVLGIKNVVNAFIRLFPEE